MTLDIPNEYESVLHRLVASGAFPTTESALKHALQLLADQQEVSVTMNGSQPIQAMPNQIDIDELAEEQDAAVFESGKLAPDDVWPCEESVDDFISFVKESRNDVSKPGANH